MYYSGSSGAFKTETHPMLKLSKMPALLHFKMHRIIKPIYFKISFLAILFPLHRRRNSPETWFSFQYEKIPNESK